MRRPYRQVPRGRAPASLSTSLHRQSFMESTALSAESEQEQIRAGVEFSSKDGGTKADLTPGSLRESIRQFEVWLSTAGYLSFDPYDVWGTGYGLTARRLYYEKYPLGMPMVAPLLLMEILCPSLRRLFVKRGRFATADAQLLLAWLNLYEATENTDYLEKARRLGSDLLSYSVSGYHGYCWGYPFIWQNHAVRWPANLPYITCTPYCYEAFAKLYDLTLENQFAEIARSISEFIAKDIRDTQTSANAAAASYSPLDNGQVINASAYRAFVLFDAGRRFDCPEYLQKAELNLNFILQNQRPDGSWLYAVATPAEAFIDHFHTCFVLKNLVKINRSLRRADVFESIRKGYAYYARELFDERGLPKSFAIQPRTGLVRSEMYDFAEAITLGALLRGEFPDAFSRARAVAEVLLTEYQLPDGHFVTRVYKGGRRHTCPFLRWPQSQLFLALTNLFLASGERRSRADSVSSSGRRDD